jgi:murein DD-endopeptidase MepM/ murein hydrolase activator NlpD
MTPGITWPLVSNVIRKNKLSNTFGMVRTYANGSPKPHQGWDFAAQVGTTAYAIANGKVESVADYGDYGKRITLKFEVAGKTYYAFYAHMQHIYKASGATVEIDEVIGTTGKSGNASNLAASEDHLHFEIRTTAAPGLGLAGRVSPFVLYGICPLNAPIAG